MMTDGDMQATQAWIHAIASSPNQRSCAWKQRRAQSGKGVPADPAEAAPGWARPPSGGLPQTAHARRCSRAGRRPHPRDAEGAVAKSGPGR